MRGLEPRAEKRTSSTLVWGTSRYGGNGRHATLRALCSQGRSGSTPDSGTKAWVPRKEPRSPNWVLVRTHDREWLCGGIGIRGSLKNCCPMGREGSNPFRATSPDSLEARTLR